MQVRQIALCLYKKAFIIPRIKKTEPGIFTVKIPLLTGLFGKLTYLPLPCFWQSLMFTS